jgi:hypothetical protein
MYDMCGMICMCGVVWYDMTLDKIINNMCRHSSHIYSNPHPLCDVLLNQTLEIGLFLICSAK